MYQYAFVFIALLLASCTSPSNHQFTSETIDIGVVVKDINKSVKFYHEVLGLKEIPGFTGTSQITGDSGLANYQSVGVRIFTLGDTPTASKVKLMQFTEAPGKLSSQKFINSTYGFSYITIFVKDMNAARCRLSS